MSVMLKTSQLEDVRRLLAEHESLRGLISAAQRGMGNVGANIRPCIRVGNAGSGWLLGEKEHPAVFGAILAVLADAKAKIEAELYEMGVQVDEAAT